MEYLDFIKTKLIHNIAYGKDISLSKINSALFPFQKDIVRWAVKKGRCALFLDTGLGKTHCQTEWAQLIGKRSLIIAPLSVARQTVRLAKKITNTDVYYTRDGKDLKEGINITNYEMIDKFNPSDFDAVVLDESSILKSLDGKTKQLVIEMFAKTPYRLCCTATPAPNDESEIGNHAEFLGIMRNNEMLATFFIHANKVDGHEFVDNSGNLQIIKKKQSGKNGQEWRIRNYARESYYHWMSTWSMSIKAPSNLGYEDKGYILPKLNINPIFINVDYVPEGQIIFTKLKGIADRANVRKSTFKSKIDEIIKLVHTKSMMYINRHEQIPKIWEDMGSEEPRQNTSIPIENEETKKCSEAGIVCQGGVEEVEGEITSKKLAEEKSVPKEKPKTKTIRNRCESLQENSEKTREKMCDMRVLEFEKQKLFPNGGSLPQNKKSERTALYELQPRDREIQGQSEIVNKGSEIFKDQWLIWCGLDIEQDTLEKIFGNDCVSVYGSLSIDEKENRILQWQSGQKRILISKPKVCGFGMNFQNAHNMIFVGMSDSWETFYQCIRRQWRFGQDRDVNVYIVLTNLECQIYENVMAKEKMAEIMSNELISRVQKYEEMDIKNMKKNILERPKQKVNKSKKFTSYLGDSCKILKTIKSESIDISVYSPPFADLYTYSASEFDLGNSRNWDEFFEHYGFIIREILRVTKQGRMSCVHTSDIAAMQIKDGYIGLKDFPGAVIKAHEKEGWIYHGYAIVSKNPQAQAIRTHSKGLLFVQMKKDSSCSRPCILDRILFFKKPGDSHVDVTPVKNGEIDNEKWIDWAGGIWTGISESDTLQFTTARAKDDEKHICPLQLGTIERCIKLYSNPNETLLTPFMGIGSEAYQAIKFGRKAIGIELKESYYNIAVENLMNIESKIEEFRII
jgi:DNA modification methylase